MTADLLTSALSAIAFIPCAMAAAAPPSGQQPRSQARRREVVVNGKRVKTIDVHAHCIVPGAYDGVMTCPDRRDVPMMRSIQ